VLAIDTTHKNAEMINSIEDVEKVLGIGTLDVVRNWFRMYKTTDGKPENSFSNGGEFLGLHKTIGVINECHHHWKDLVYRNNLKSKLDKTSLTINCLNIQNNGDCNGLDKFKSADAGRGRPLLV